MGIEGRTKIWAEYYLKGYWLGDGSGAPGRDGKTIKEIRIYGNATDQARLKEVFLFLEIEYVPRFNSPTVWVCTIYAKDRWVLRGLDLLQRSFVRHFRNLKLETEEKKSGLLSGLFDSDGSVRPVNVQFDSSSLAMAEGVKDLLEQLGMTPFSNSYKQRSGRADQHVVRLRKYDYERFHEIVTLQDQDQLVLEAQLLRRALSASAIN